MTLITVVVNTYNGAATLPRALRSVLAQADVDMEVVVADDGSDPPAEAIVRAEFPDVDVRVVSQPNAGLSASRNLGARSARGDIVVFLDDDDELLPGALVAFDQLLSPSVGIACGGVEMVHVASDEPGYLRTPQDLGEEMDGVTGSVLPGSWAVSKVVLDAVGGFDVEARCNHQREFFLRAVPWCLSNGLVVASTDQPVLRMYRRPAAERPRNDPERLQQCLEYLIGKHGDRIGRDRSRLSSIHSSAGVAAARNGDLSSARSHFGAAIRAQPSDVRSYARLAGAMVPPVARRTWR